MDERDLVTREELKAHLEAQNERALNNAVEVGTKLITKAMEQHVKACPHGQKLDRHLAKIVGVTAGISASSVLVGILVGAIVRYVVMRG